MAMRRYILISNGERIIAEGDTMEELERIYREYGANPAHHAEALPKFTSIEPCIQEDTMGKLCIMDTEENPTAAESYYNATFQSGEL